MVSACMNDPSPYFFRVYDLSPNPSLPNAVSPTTFCLMPFSPIARARAAPPSFRHLALLVWLENEVTDGQTLDITPFSRKCNEELINFLPRFAREG